MREVIGDMWAYEYRKNFRLLITTNGSIRKDGCGVMGRDLNNALEAAMKHPELPELLGFSLKRRGNVVSLLIPGIYSFPVKRKWFEAADLRLIKESRLQLHELAMHHPDIKYVLPRPGCGNGKLKWEQVQQVISTLPDNVLVISKEA